jgi:hypothetical protein
MTSLSTPLAKALPFHFIFTDLTVRSCKDFKAC